MSNRLKHLGVLVLFIILVQLAGIIGSFFTIDAIGNWYVFLDKPSFSPPNWVFGPVWIILYTLMATATFLIWKKRHGLRPSQAQARDKGFWLFWVHLLFNALWSILFFGLQNPLWALIDIGVLLVLICAVTFYYFRVSSIAGLLMIPYILWVSFATVLNLGIYLLN